MKRTLLLIALLAAGLPALAQKPTVSMLDLNGAGDVRDADVVAITDSLAAALDKAGAFDVIAPAQRDQLLMRRGFWIEGFKSLPERLVVAGRCLAADRMIGGQLAHTAAGFDLSLQLVDVTTGAVTEQFRQERLSGLGGVLGSLTDAVRQFLGAAQPADSLKSKAPRGSCKIDSRPSGAKLYVDGLLRGVTPQRVDSLLVGPHQAFLDLDKFRRTYYVIRVKKGGVDSLMVRLEPKKAGEPDRPAPGNPQANETARQPVSDEAIPDTGVYVAVDKSPEPVNMPQPVYPADAKKAGISGRVYIQMLVNIDGHVARADVAKSSGNATLDAAAVGAAKRWMFTPAIAPGGKPVRVWVMQSFAFGNNPQQPTTKETPASTSVPVRDITGSAPDQRSLDDIPDKNAFIAVDKNPEPVKKPMPIYPEIVKKAGIGGKVYIQMLIDTNGHVIRADVAKSSGNQSLDNAAAEAAMQWLFTPAIAPGGKPVRVWVMEPFTFKLN